MCIGTVIVHPGTQLSERNWVLGEMDALLKGSLLIE